MTDVTNKLKKYAETKGYELREISGGCGSSSFNLVSEDTIMITFYAGYYKLDEKQLVDTVKATISVLAKKKTN